MNGSDPLSCPVLGFGVNNVEVSSSANREVISSVSIFQ
jgi:hypothetical protein